MAWPQLVSPPPLGDALALILDLPRRIGAWRQRRRTSPAWTVTVALILAVIALPAVTVLLLALAPADNIWPHLLQTVLPGSLLRTLLLAAGTGALAFAVGTATAWLVTLYRFPGRAVVDRLLVLPLAVPT